MFSFLGFLFVLVGVVPFIVVLVRRNRYSRSQLLRKLGLSGMVFAADIAILIALNVFMHFYTQLAWFQGLGYAERYWTVFLTKILLYGIGAGVFFAFLYANLVSAWSLTAPHGLRRAALPLSIIVSLLMAFFTSSMWRGYLLFANQAPSRAHDPIFGAPIGLYLFTIPFVSELIPWLVFMVLITMAFVSIPAFLQRRSRTATTIGGGVGGLDPLNLLYRRLMFLAGFLALLISVSMVLSLFRLVESQAGVVKGAGFTDVHYRVPGLIITIVLYMLLAVSLWVGSGSPAIRRLVLGIREVSPDSISPFTPKTGFIAIGFFGLLLVVNVIVPALVSSFFVKPNEITLEAPYLKDNITFTQRAYGIDSSNIQERQFAAVNPTLNSAVAADNQDTLDNVRLWDPRALLDNLKQQQEIRLYYDFPSVSVDRYRIDGKERQMMIAVREIDLGNLAPSSRTWVSTRLKYTHGYGAVLLPAHKFINEGQPDLLIRNIPPVSSPNTPRITQPAVYYGQMTRTPAYVDTTQKEFDYPKGDSNVYSSYAGDGGVVINSFFKRFLYAWRFDDVQLLFSGYITPKTRILFQRQIVERASTVAPFLEFDGKPYPVITQKGHLAYILDAYTTSGHYPYSQVYDGTNRRYTGINYIRNSVKAVVDAYNGTVTFYVMKPNDIMIRTYERMFPGMFKPFGEMPADLTHHIRYPEDLLGIQAEMLRVYHMNNVQSFYQREDVWQFATERYRQGFQPVEPYYVLMQFPGQDTLRYVLMLPFTPKNKNVITAWIAGRSDLANYGKLTVFTFPKGEEIIGPKQIEARVDQNTEMSRAMTLWGQHGSEVIRGNLLAIPMFTKQKLHLMYVEPIFLQAQDAKLPEIKRVVVADPNRVVWAKTFAEAVSLLTKGVSLSGGTAAVVTSTTMPQNGANANGSPGSREVGPEAPGSPGSAIGQAASVGARATVGSASAVASAASAEEFRKALDYLQQYRKLSGEGNFSQAGDQLGRLEQLLRQNAGTSNGKTAGSSGSVGGSSGG